jgi:hypothetical protein
MNELKVAGAAGLSPPSGADIVAGGTTRPRVRAKVCVAGRSENVRESGSGNGPASG